jgi:threonyl-tRNA synthetase
MCRSSIRAEILSRPAFAHGRIWICNRYEPSGALHGIMRVRGFTQDDAHIFCTEDQIEAETKQVHRISYRSIYATWALRSSASNSRTAPTPARALMRFGTRPKQRSGKCHPSGGNRAELNPGEGAFYGPKAGICADRRHWPRLAMWHASGGFRSARTLDATYIGKDGANTAP